LALAAVVWVVRQGSPGHAAAGGAAVLQASVAAGAAVRGVRRAGVNLGIWTYWGAEQLSSNVLKNPGFEGMIDRAIVMVQSAGPRRFSDDQTWTARPEGFWKGATADVRTGKAAGRQSRVVNSTQAGRFGLPQFETADDLGLSPGDVVALTRIDDASVPAGWWIPPDSASAVAAVPEHRPGSAGVRSVSLAVRPDRTAQIISYLDTITERAGKLLPVNGKWRISFWTAARDGGGSLRVRFLRQGASAFFDQAVTPGPEWQRQAFEFDAIDAGPTGPLELHFEASGNAGRILVDDVELRSEADDCGFRKPVEDTLAKLLPALLRDWQGQLGDTFENRVADAFGRRTTRYRPGTASDSDYLYPVPDFLDLCHRVGADPWLLAPVTFGDAEWDAFGRFLAQQQRRYRFSEILVEFGNENWNRIFRFAAIPEPQAHGEAASRAARLLRAAAGPEVPLRFVVNGQHASPLLTEQFARAAAGADVVAVAPYFFPALARGVHRQDAYRTMFAGDGGRLGEIAGAVAAAGKETAVYEVNLNTVAGDAPPKERDALVAGRISASALAKTLLDAVAEGVRRQCVWTLSGFDVQAAGGSTRLFGLVRDFGDTGRLRPTGMAVELLNRAIEGDFHAVAGIPPRARVSAYAFEGKAGWSVALVSASGESQDVALTLPPDGAMPAHLYEIASDTPDATNEDLEGVRIVEDSFQTSGRTVTVNVPAWGLAVLTQGVVK
jgi:hypothetical protein